MSILLRRLQRDPKFQKQEPTPAPEPAPVDTSGLGDAIAQVIRAQVQQQVKEAVKQAPAPAPKVAPHLREFTDEPLSDKFPPPAPMAKPVRDLTVSLQRGADDKVRSVSIGSVKFTALRDGAGKLIGMRQED